VKIGSADAQNDHPLFENISKRTVRSTAGAELARRLRAGINISKVFFMVYSSMSEGELSRIARLSSIYRFLIRRRKSSPQRRC
jgi:hypothetical protein